jgi:hypothetical protein
LLCGYDAATRAAFYLFVAGLGLLLLVLKGVFSMALWYMSKDS